MQFVDFRMSAECKMSPAYHDSLNLSYNPTLNIQVKWLSSCRINVYAPKHHFSHSESLMSTEDGSTCQNQEGSGVKT